ncbi:MAG: biotin--[acetyl-CoA-carboxylase] ligase [Betaproteobacteria bacterium]|nr:biotin--[acetyl-CoA-carboxylase] ligase [Betaproteobacteria bacterium]
MDRLDQAQISVPGLEIRVLERCTSTNAVLLAEDAAHPVLLAAEVQTGGRGRRGRKWHSAPGAGATFSILRRMRCAARRLSGLSLAVGVAAARALRALGAGAVALKWPNDLLVGEAKLGGILIETRQQGSATSVVVGIGINCRRRPAQGARLRRRAISLEALLRPAPARNAVIAAVAREVLRALEAFERSGLPGFVDDWRALHAHEGQRLRVRLDDGHSVSGFADGVAPDGALRLRTRSGTREVSSGRVVSARAARAPRARAA